MKLIVLILALTLCTAFRFHEKLPDIDDSDFLIDFDQDDNMIIVSSDGTSDFDEPLVDNSVPRWLFNDDRLLQTEEEAALNEEENVQAEEDLLTQIRNDPELNEIFTFGVGNLIAGGINKGKIPNLVYNVANVTSFTTTSSSLGDRYLFSATAVSADGNSVIDMNFTVYIDHATQTKSLRAFSYEVRTTTPTAPQYDNDYVQLTPAEIATDPEVRDALAYGADQVIARGIASGKIPDSDFVLTNVVSVYRRRQPGVNNYRYSVELQNLNNVLVQAQYRVSVNTANGDMELESYAFQVSRIPFTIDESKFVSLPASDATNNATVKSVLDYAIAQIIKQPGFVLQKVNSVAVQTVNGVNYYKFDVSLTNNSNKTIGLVTTVAHNPSNGDMAVKTYTTRTVTVTPRG